MRLEVVLDQVDAAGVFVPGPDPLKEVEDVGPGLVRISAAEELVFCYVERPEEEPHPLALPVVGRDPLG